MRNGELGVGVRLEFGMEGSGNSLFAIPGVHSDLGGYVVAEH